MPPPKADGEAPTHEHDRTTEADLATKLQNPLVGLTQDEILADADAFVESKGLAEHRDVFRKGALISQVINIPNGFEDLEILNEEDKAVLRKEETHRWSQPKMLYFLCMLCAGSAIVQGMDQTAVNGAQQFYFEEFEITDPLMQGLLNGAPYLCSALIGCWTNAPLNKFFGRRGTIFISCFISVVTGIWMAAADR